MRLFESTNQPQTPSSSLSLPPPGLSPPGTLETGRTQQGAWMLYSQGMLGGQLPVPSACLDQGKPPKSWQLLTAGPPPFRRGMCALPLHYETSVSSPASWPAGGPQSFCRRGFQLCPGSGIQRGSRAQGRRCGWDSVSHKDAFKSCALGPQYVVLFRQRVIADVIS